MCIDIYSKYLWVAPLKDKKDVTIVNAFQKILDNSMELHSKRKPNKIWVDKVTEFCNRSIKSWLQEYDIKMYSTHNEGKSVVVGRFIKTLKNKVYVYMTSESKNVYIHKVDDIANDYDNTYHGTIKMKPVDVKSGNYIECNVNSYNKDPKIQKGDNARMSKHKNIFATGCTPN